jgi:hypothetical protein
MEKEMSHQEAINQTNAHAFEQPGLRFLPTKQLLPSMTITCPDMSNIMEKQPN